jgi:hypothetical protein
VQLALNLLLGLDEVFGLVAKDLEQVDQQP